MHFLSRTDYLSLGVPKDNERSLSVFFLSTRALIYALLPVSAMVGPKSSLRQRSVRRKKSGAVPDTQFSSAPFHVSSETNPKDSKITSAQEPDSTGLRETLPEWPITSGGFSTRTVIRDRQMRGDFYFNPLITHQAGTMYFNFPAPRKMAPTTFPEPEHLEPDDQMEIGMALGSPSHPPPGWKSQARLEISSRLDSPEPFEPVTGWDISSASSKQKPSKWKMFSLFGRKSSTTTFYQLQSNAATTSETNYVQFPPLSSTAKPHEQSTSPPQKTKIHKAELKRANTAPSNFNFQESSAYLKSDNSLEIRLDTVPLLNVEIPNTQMERYSIMFGSVLKPDSQTSVLLARRQATLENIGGKEAVSEQVSIFEYIFSCHLTRARRRRRGLNWTCHCRVASQHQILQNRNRFSIILTPATKPLTKISTSATAEV